MRVTFFLFLGLCNINALTSDAIERSISAWIRLRLGSRCTRVRDFRHFLACLIVIHISSVRRVHSDGMTRVSTIAQKATGETVKLALQELQIKEGKIDDKSLS